MVLEHEVGRNMVVSASYLGSLGRELPNFVDTNLTGLQPVTYTVFIPGTATTGIGSPLANGAAVFVPTYTKRINPKFNAITDFTSNVNSSYNALVLQANRRMSHGLQFMTNYTWSHALDFNQNSTTGTFTNNFFDPANPRLDYGNSNFDVRQRFVASVIYQPTYKFQGVVGRLLNDYSISPIVAVQTGLPYTIGVSGNSPVGAGTGINGTGALGRIAELGRNTSSFPRTSNTDLRISKKIPVDEKYNFELIGEAFNLFNHQNVTAIATSGFTICTSPTTVGCSPTASKAAPVLSFNNGFGLPTNANSNTSFHERQIQLALRFNF
jgi:hypothetical protein